MKGELQTQTISFQVHQYQKATIIGVQSRLMPVGILLFQIFNLFIYFLPQNHPSLQLWLTTDRYLNETAGFVDVWKNRVDTGIVFAQVLVSDQPLKVDSVPLLNYHSTIVFDGINDYLNAGDTLDLNKDDRTLFLVGKTSANDRKTFFSKAAQGALNLDRYAIYYRLNELNFQYTDTSLKNVVIPSPNDTSYNILTTKTTRESGINELFRNEILLGQATGVLDSTYVHNSTYRLMLGAYGNSTDTDEEFHLDGSISEVLVFNEALNDSLRNLIEGYIRCKYAPPVNLGADISVNYGFCDTVIDASPRFVEYIWSTGDSTQTIITNSTGEYSVTVTDVFGFTSSDTILLEYSDRLSFRDTTICLYGTLLLNTGLDTIAYDFLWDDGSTGQQKNIYTQGEHWVWVTDTFGCSLFDTIFVVIDSFATNTTLGNDTSLCAGNILELESPSNVVSYLWNDSITDSVLIVNAMGTYWVHAISNFGCETFDTVIVGINGTSPTVSFLTDTMCLNNEFNFVDMSFVPPPESISSWTWSFATGDSAFTQNPTYQFPTTGSFDVTLEVVTDSGCVNSLAKTVYVLNDPQANFSFPVACAESNVLFEAFSSSDPLDSITSYNWIIDGNSYAGENVIINFTTENDL